MLARLAVTVLAAKLATGAAIAATDGLIAPPDGMTEVHAEHRAPDSYAVPLHPAGGNEPVTAPREGDVFRRSFRGARPATPLGAIEAAAARLVASGFATVFDCAARACGGFDFRLAIDVLPLPAMMMNPADFHQRTLEGTGAGDAPVTVSLLASRFGGVTHLQTVTVIGPAPAESAGAVTAPVAALRLRAEPGTAEAMLARLERQGRVVLDGIDFDSAAAAKEADDPPVLDAAAALLEARPDLSVAIVGHSDNVGGLEANIRLSRARADAVVEALVARGISRDRLDAQGAGWLAPLRSNATPEGRAANRRVEMVLRN